MNFQDSIIQNEPLSRDFLVGSTKRRLNLTCKLNLRRDSWGEVLLIQKVLALSATNSEALRSNPWL
jgi:hypothetical protein